MNQRFVDTRGQGPVINLCPLAASCGWGSVVLLLNSFDFARIHIYFLYQYFWLCSKKCDFKFYCEVCGLINSSILQIYYI